MKRTPLKRGTKGLRRTGWLRRKKPMARVSERRRRQRAAYGPAEKAHLDAHPFCQLTIAYCRFDEAAVLRRGAGLNASNCQGLFFQGVLIPIATEVHHRNKAREERLADPRWMASASRRMHDWVENHKDQARAEGYLLPLEADKDGRLPNGSQCLTTDQWLAARARNKA